MGLTDGPVEVFNSNVRAGGGSLTRGLDLPDTSGPIMGDVGRDVIEGCDGDDSFDGGTWADTIAGGAGNDTLTGGGGPDVIILEAGADSDTITDFTNRTEKIDVSAFGLPFNYANVNAFQSLGGVTSVSFDTTDNVIGMQGFSVGNFDAGDFIF